MLTKIVRLTIFLLLIPMVSVAQDLSHEQGEYKFIENGGQWPEWVNYKGAVAGGYIWLETGGILYDWYNVDDFHHHLSEVKGEFNPTAERVVMYAEFVDCNTDANTEPANPTSEYFGYFLGNDPDKWATGLHAYHDIKYKEIYQGIDLLYYEKEGHLKYEYHIAPGADPNQIKTKYHGETKIRINRNGELEVESKLGQIIEEKPYVYQVKNGKVIEIECSFLLEDDVVSFELGDYDESLELVIDPILVFATYCGSVTDNFGMTATYAYDGKAYSGGMIYGNAYPTPGPAWNTSSNFTVANIPSPVTTDVFISKYSEDGTQMIWTNFVGGGDDNVGTETVHSLICDTSDNIYMYGVTSSTDFPLMNAYQGSHAGGAALSVDFNGTNFGTTGTDIYVTKISSDGLSLMGSTYVGGAGNDGVNYKVTSGTYNNVAFYDSLTTNYGDQFRGEIMLDSMNNVLIASMTRSTDFPTVNPFQGANAGQQDGVVFMLSADFSSLLWSSYYGGSENDACYSVKIDSSYNILFAGGTSSADIPGTIGGLYPTYQGGKCDGFVAKLTPDGSTLTQSTYIGTNVYDQTIFVEIDRWDNVYIVGQSLGNMPVINAPYSNPNSSQYIMKLLPDLTAIDYSTIFGNGNLSINISPSAFLVDVCGNVYVSGWGANILQATPLSGMPVTGDAFQGTPPNGFDFYLFVLERDAQSMLYGSYIGGGSPGTGSNEHVDGGTSRFDKFGVVYQSVCGGCLNNGQNWSDFPTTPGAWSATNDAATNCNNLLFKFDFEIVPEADFLISDLEGCAPFTFTLDNESNDTVNSVWSFPPEAIIVQGGINPVIMFESPGTYNIILSITDTICNLQDTALKVINVYDSLDLQLVSQDTVLCNSITYDLIANSFGTATDFLWFDDPGLTNQINLGGLDSVASITPVTTTTYYVQASNGWQLCDKIDSVVVIMADGAMSIDAADTICLGDTTLLMAHNLLPSETMTFDWSPNQYIIAELDSTALVVPPQSMWFYVTGTTGSGCIFVDSVWVETFWIDPNLVYATATPDSVPEGGSTVLEAFPNNSAWTYTWAPTIYLNSSIGQTVNATGMDQSVNYEVTITGGGCEAKTQAFVTVLEFICGDIYIFIPSAFTPNGDGENDVLYVRGQNLTEIDLKIFDRWGELVFESTDQSVGWDGTFKGELLDPDVYVYHLTAICFDGQEALIKGNISLLK